MPHSPAGLVLLVEDDDADAHLIEAAMAEAAPKVILRRVVDGVEGLAYLRRQGPYADAPRPDLVLLDLNMPRLDGREFLALVKQDPDLRVTPLVVLSTSDAEPDLQKCYRLGASGYVVKPMEIDKLFDAMRVLSAYWLGVVRPPPHE